ncbi:uncharacterized protein METZ01_LOCUS249931, partial [marine metagenome]
MIWLSTIRAVFGVLFVSLILAGCAPKGPADYDLIIQGGTIYDGSGENPAVADIGISGDRIVAIGDLQGKIAEEVINADGFAVAPGFINMLSWATETLIQDGRAMSDIMQGVTLEVMGE